MPLSTLSPRDKGTSASILPETSSPETMLVTTQTPRGQGSKKTDEKVHN